MNDLFIARRRSDLRIIWIGVDGSRWVLHGAGARQEGAWIETVKGILDPPSTLRTRSSARQRGSTPGTVKVDERVIDLTVHLTATTDDPLPVVERRWDRSWSMEQDGRLWVITDDSARWFDVRPREDIEVDLAVDPRRRGVVTMEMTLVACDVDAHGHTDTTDWQCAGETTVVLSNPTDLPAWPTFVAEAGQWTFPDGVSGDTVALKQATQPIVVRTLPGVEKVTYADGTPGYPLLAGQRFTQPLPPHTPPTEVTVTGTGALQIITERRWKRGW